MQGFLQKVGAFVQKHVDHIRVLPAILEDPGDLLEGESQAFQVLDGAGFFDVGRSVKTIARSGVHMIGLQKADRMVMSQGFHGQTRDPREFADAVHPVSFRSNCPRLIKEPRYLL